MYILRKENTSSISGEMSCKRCAVVAHETACERWLEHRLHGLSLTKPLLGFCRGKLRRIIVFYLLNHVHEIYVHKERRYLFDKLPSSNVNYCFVDILAFCNENCEFGVIFDFEKLQVMQLIYYRYGKKILLIILKNKIVYIYSSLNFIICFSYWR